jgi:alkylation response protein AidB-like acyl-CoA dehydrogenase
LGLNSCPLSEVTLTDCFIPEENVLGTPDSGKMIFISALEWERIYEFAPHIGAMHRVIDSCMKYVNERKQFGQNIGEFQAVSHKIANMKIHFELSRNMLYKIAWMKDQGKNAFTDASIFKVFVSESYIQACRDALQIFGAYGYTKEYDIERELRDALACSIYSGTNEIQRNTIYRMMNLECSLR